jgi:hypothetical protein
MHKKILQRHEAEKKIVPQKFYAPPLPGLLMVRPLYNLVIQITDVFLIGVLSH